MPASFIAIQIISKSNLSFKQGLSSYCVKWSLSSLSEHMRTVKSSRALYTSLYGHSTRWQGGILEELGYGCTGIGDTFAHAFIKELLRSRAKCGKGEVLAYRIIKDAIEIGLDWANQLIYVKIVNEKPEIHNLTSDEILASNDTHYGKRQRERYSRKKT